MLAPRDSTPIWEAYVFSVRVSGYLEHVAELVELSAGGADRALPIRERRPTLLRIANDLRGLAHLMQYEAMASDEQ
jgi:hypothetical protein